MIERRYWLRSADSYKGPVRRSKNRREMMKDAFAFLGMRSSFGTKIARSTLKLAPLTWLMAAGMAQAGDIAVTDAWTPPDVEIGSDAVLGMVVTNGGADPDALVRVSCPVANFSEKRQVDTGEGGKAAREVHDIPIPANSKVILNSAGFHVALLQTRNKLEQGQEFQCSISFRRAGTIQVQVHVSQNAP
jgi:periplasmic copper chaperone A